MLTIYLLTWSDKEAFRHPPITMKLNANEAIRRESTLLREELTFDTVQTCTSAYLADEMIEVRMMYHEVFFADCTGCANHQRRGYFISVICTPRGTYHMYNIILIPSIKNFIPSIVGIFLVSLS